MTESSLPRLVGGPADGAILPDRYADSPRIQVPATNGLGEFATYVKNASDPRRFMFDGFTR